jgi:hypothetical protein
VRNPSRPSRTFFSAVCRPIKWCCWKIMAVCRR